MTSPRRPRPKIYLKEVRHRRGVSRAELAETARFGVGLIEKWEAGLAPMYSEYIPRLVHALHCTYDELFEGCEGPYEGRKLRLAKIRKERKMSQQVLARLMDLCPRTISLWECGKAYPHEKYRLQLAEIFGITQEELFEAREETA